MPDQNETARNGPTSVSEASPTPPFSSSEELDPAKGGKE